MSDISYEDARVEGGIRAFDDVLRLDRIKDEIGDEPIPSPEGAKRYTEQVRSIEESRRIGELIMSDDEDLVA